MLVLPSKCVNELRALSNSVASPTVAHAHNLMGGHTNMNIILKNNLHFRTLQLKLTPNLTNLTEPMQEELNLAVKEELPECSGDHTSSTSEATTNSRTERWVTIRPYHSILALVARISARIFVGLPLCRNAEWLEVSTQFTENGKYSLVVASPNMLIRRPTVFVSLVILRLMPMWSHYVLSWVLHPFTVVTRMSGELKTPCARNSSSASSGSFRKTAVG